MKRGLVFMLLGPVCGVLAALLPDVARGGFDIVIALIGMSVLLYSIFVSMVTAVADGALEDILPIYWRAPLIAVAGAVIAAGPVLPLSGLLPQLVLAVAVVGALSMGMCSLLSHDYGRNQAAVKDELR
jgi:hypothetical protein